MNFTNLQNQNTLNLRKNDILDLTKAAPTLNNCMLAAGWDIMAHGVNADLDISAFLLDSNERGIGVVYFNAMQANGIQLMGDNRTGRGDGDDEQIMISLNDIDSNVQSIIFNITIYNAANLHQTFGMVKNAYVRLVDTDTDKEICRYPLTSDFSTDTAVIVCSLKRNNENWEFHALGEGFIGNLQDLYNRYL